MEFIFPLIVRILTERAVYDKIIIIEMKKKEGKGCSITKTNVVLK